MDKALTSFSKGSGCGCKIQPAVLEKLLDGLRLENNSSPSMLLANSMNEDCAALELPSGEILLQTLDFFTPMVNDAGVFGKAAAANALSDIYAMGGIPLMANSIFGWPIDKISLEIAKDVLKGGTDVCDSLNVPLSGGHSIDSQDPIYGLSVTGIVNKENLKTNSGAKPGDLIILTKELGIGMMAAAHKRGVSNSNQDKKLFELLTSVNSLGADLGKEKSVSSMTDITGFGLLGHLMEICNASGVSAVLDWKKIPHAIEAVELARTFVLPDNAMRNWNSYETNAVIENSDAFAWVVDPQTNGGLLLTVDPSQIEHVLNICRIKNPESAVIGEVHDSIQVNKKIIIN